MFVLEKRNGGCAGPLELVATTDEAGVNLLHIIPDNSLNREYLSSLILSL